MYKNLHPKYFRLAAEYDPSGDQPKAIGELSDRIESGETDIVLLGATGTGKSATIAWLIEKLARPTLIIAHNKTLAAQLANEFRKFFPDNAVEYFVSYYDYYQPEAYVPKTDTFIEKDASVNSEVERLRHRATTSLLTRRDVIVVATVSCIYGLGAPSEYLKAGFRLEVGQKISQRVLLERFTQLQYNRNDVGFERGNFRVRGDTIEIIPVYEEYTVRIEMWGDEIERVLCLHPVTGNVLSEQRGVLIFPASHYVTSSENLKRAIVDIRKELQQRLRYFKRNNSLLEAQRLETRTEYDIELMEQLGFCSGVENYSRHIDGRAPGEPPFCLLDYFDDDFLTVIDESHVTVPQIGSMHAGDFSRKKALVENGFRLPSAIDNRPLCFDEFRQRVGQVIYLSATPGKYELSKSDGVVEQIIRPTGLVDPKITVKPIKGQIDDLLEEIRKRKLLSERVLVTTLTKRMAEELTDFLSEAGVNVSYLHSDIDTLHRVELLTSLRMGRIDVLVGINLLREGLDLPEVSLVAILDADKEGFLRSTTSFIQTIGRAARHVSGEVHMYADNMTESMQKSIDETNRRRRIQQDYNRKMGVTPVPIKKTVSDITEVLSRPSRKIDCTILDSLPDPKIDGKQIKSHIKSLEAKMYMAAESLMFEEAAELRDEIQSLKEKFLKPRGSGGKIKQ
uniref:excinuclease ABC subunit UvrB n=1 Tax=Tropheryma whipplei TaxID=2039 RepID=UPI0004BA1953|nr:excinuclease ABC subunit UvrB [Tropheryma whipplei]